MKRLIFLVAFIAGSHAGAETMDYLVKVAPGVQAQMQLKSALPVDAKVAPLGVGGWQRVEVAAGSPFRMQSLMQNRFVVAVQPNYKIRSYVSPSLERAREMAAQLAVGISAAAPKATDNPDIPTGGGTGQGADPLYSKQWGMNQNKVKESWEKTTGSPEMIVAVLDTGVDYTHEDLVDNLWRNPGETGRDAQGRDKAHNNVDDDKNGYVDDVVGYDFYAKDNKPYDLALSFTEIVFGGGNPGHGTHCAGNVAARSDNGKGIAGVAPNIRIMALRFISEKGQGTTADAILAIKYAVDNGAKITSNSWGSEGEDKNDPENKALREAVQYAEKKGVLFVAAAGNGHQGTGYDNDTDSDPGYPASYEYDNVISVAAIDVRGVLGSFSNWGRKSVDLGAPGVKVFSTVPSNKYQDSIGNFMGQEITWDGTSMATPHVAGAAALYWSAHPDKTWQDVKEALLSSVKKSQILANKVKSGGQLDVANLMK